MRIRPVHLLLVVAAIPILMIALPRKGSEYADESSSFQGESATDEWNAAGEDERLRVLLAEANAKLEGREFFGAIRRFERVLASSGSHAEAHLGLARCSFELEELREAEEHVERALATAVEGSATHAAAIELAAEIELALGFTLDVVLPALREALSGDGRVGVEVLRVDETHCGLHVRDADGSEASLELADLSPYAVVRETPGVARPYVVTVTSPFGERLRRTVDGEMSAVSSIAFPFADRATAVRTADLFQRAVVALTDYKIGTLDEEVRRIVAAMDQRSVCVSGEFMLVGKSREYSSYSVSTYTVSHEGAGALRILREAKDIIEMDGAGGEWSTDWRIDLAQVEHVSIVRVEKRVFGPWLVRGAIGEVLFGDLLEEIDAVRIGPASAFQRTPAFIEGEEQILLLPTGEHAETLAMSLHNAALLARR